jgi:hypothetical protein
MVLCCDLLLWCMHIGRCACCSNDAINVQGRLHSLKGSADRFAEGTSLGSETAKRARNSKEGSLDFGGKAISPWRRGMAVVSKIGS